MHPDKNSHCWQRVQRSNCLYTYHKINQHHPKFWDRWHLWLSNAGAQTHRGTLGISPATGLRPTDYPESGPWILCPPLSLAHNMQTCLSWHSGATISPIASFGFLIPPAASSQTSWSLHCPAHILGCCKTWIAGLSPCSVASLTLCLPVITQHSTHPCMPAGVPVPPAAGIPDKGVLLFLVLLAW